MFFCISAKLFTLNHVKFRRFTEQLNSGLTEGLFGHARNLTQKFLNGDGLKFASLGM